MTEHELCRTFFSFQPRVAWELRIFSWGASYIIDEVTTYLKCDQSEIDVKNLLQFKDDIVRAWFATERKETWDHGLFVTRRLTTNWEDAVMNFMHLPNECTDSTDWQFWRGMAQPYQKRTLWSVRHDSS